jgi:hypothetical protein
MSEEKHGGHMYDRDDLRPLFERADVANVRERLERIIEIVRAEEVENVREYLNPLNFALWRHRLDLPGIPHGMLEWADEMMGKAHKAYFHDRAPGAAVATIEEVKRQFGSD